MLKFVNVSVHGNGNVVSVCTSNSVNDSSDCNDNAGDGDRKEVQCNLHEGSAM